MSKLTGELSYKDWMILKHALKETVEISQGTIDLIDKEVNAGLYEITSVQGYEKQKKELEEEKATLERVTKLTDNFKAYIKGNQRYYLSDPYWI